MNLENKDKEIVILGMGPGFELCDYKEGKEIWALNMGYLYAKRVDKLFMTDPIERRNAVLQGFYYEKERDKDGKLVKKDITADDVKSYISENKIDFVSSYEYKDIPTYRPYPYKAVTETLGVPYFVNTICYMIAYAIVTGVKSIELWGVNQSSPSEYVFHKACVEFWVGMALSQGIQVNIHGDGSSLLKNLSGELYGYRMPHEVLLDHLDKVGELKPPKGKK